MSVKTILMDTQVFIVALNSPEFIPSKIRHFFSSEYQLYLSIASIWEMSIKSSLGKLKFETSLKEAIQASIKESGVKILPLDIEHTYFVETLPFHHRDPFDRILVAQSILEKMPIISSDAAFDTYGITRYW